MVVMGPILNCYLNHFLTSIVNIVEFQTKIQHTLPPTCSSGVMQRSSVVTPSLLRRSRYSGDGDTVHWAQDTDMIQTVDDT